MTPRPWQRQPAEAPGDFSAFACYLRLKGRRSARAVAAQTGRPLAAIRRLSASFHWPARVAAFEARLADATQDALDSVLRQQPAAQRSQLDQLRLQEFQLTQQIIQASHRWLELACDPHRRHVSLTQICRLIDLAFKLSSLATGMPGLDPPRRRKKEDAPGYWTAPSMEEALQRAYGDKAMATTPTPPLSATSRTSAIVVPAAGGNNRPSASPQIPSSRPQAQETGPSCAVVPPATPPPAAERPKCDLMAVPLVRSPEGLLTLDWERARPA